MAQKNIESEMHEMRVIPPSPEFKKRASLQEAELNTLYEHAAADYIGFWANLAVTELAWHKPFTHALNDAQAPNYRWFADGELNVSYNCLDVNLAHHADKLAIVFEGEPGDVVKLTYRELHREVSRLGNALRAQGIQKGDRVVIYMPMIPEAVIAMQACARIGAVHSVVFGGFSANAVQDRIEDAGAKMVITADGGWRGGKRVELKQAVDKALEGGCRTVECVIVVERTGGPCSMQAGRDIWWQDVVSGRSEVCTPEWVEAEHPLFLLYTSGSTGKPKGIQHSSAGYLLGVKLTSRWTFDFQAADVFWCTADVGWVTGHSYVAYGPLAAGATVMIYEGGPTFPDGGRFWQICESHGVTIFYTAPTAIRALMKLGDDIPAKYNLKKLRLLGSVGEPINPEAWMWYHRVIGKQRCPIVDTWWQTETGCIMMTPVPGVTPTKPGSCCKPLPGIFIDIVDDEGRAVKKVNAGGYLVIKRPWPSMLRTIWGDNERYLSTYWEKFQNRYYVAGDSAHRDADGYYWLMGRIDDVLNVAGHRLGTMEIESALVAHSRVAESAVVSKLHDVKGESVFAYVVLKGARPLPGAAETALIAELRDWVGAQLSPIAKPDEIRLTEQLPKTRSGKIMRRLLRSLARGEAILQDISTLENPAILDQLRDGGVAVSAPAAAVVVKRAKRQAATRKVATRKKVIRKKAMRKKATRKKATRKKVNNKGLPRKRGVVKSKKLPSGAKVKRAKPLPMAKTQARRKVPVRRKVRGRVRGKVHAKK